MSPKTCPGRPRMTARTFDLDLRGEVIGVVPRIGVVDSACPRAGPVRPRGRRSPARSVARMRRGARSFVSQASIAL